MNNIINIIKSGRKSGRLFILTVMTAAISATTLYSCREIIDESDLYTFTGEMMVDHFEAEPSVFGSYLAILKQVKPGNRENASSMYSLLSARGNYTCFAPTNEAILNHMDSLCKIGQIDPSTLALVKDGDFSTVPDSVLQPIVYNSIIENGDNSAYASTDFDEGPLPLTNMNDRYISISYGNKVGYVSAAGDTSLTTVIYINSSAAVIEKDIEVENGYIQTIDHVLSPSNASVSDLIKKAENMTLFADLLKKTGYDEQLIKYKDNEWEAENENIRGEYASPVSGRSGRYPEHRYIGYTVFVETDSVFASKGITDINSLRNYVKDHAFYDDDTSHGIPTSWDDDYTKDNNWLNQFVSYHLLPERLTYNTMVIFANEYGRDAGHMEKTKPNNFSKVNVWEYWETMGNHRRTLKITGLKGEKRINRISVYNVKKDYKEIEVPRAGIKISMDNGKYANDALNGYYFPIDDILIWEKDVPQKVLNERMRYDITSMFPEFSTNNLRGNITYNVTGNGEGDILIPHDYLDGVVEISKGTAFYYLPNKQRACGNSWMNYQTDEFNIQGQYDFTMKLPPVPYTGTYEIRYGINATNAARGMAQIYFGKNPKNLPALGIPLDLRAGSGCRKEATGWDPDVAGDTLTNNEIDKKMRNIGFMKGPKYITLTQGSLQGRDNELCIRKIIFTGQLEAGETYYIRFKSVLEGTHWQFFYDYLEFVPKSVYSGAESEDIW